ncbi:hopanoid biosynthesis-associated protein HpnK [Methylobacterium sp. WSM2598]|uniref:hopanoid biosynthesis-associated protein HpnK n=1 Tax=Methylobacterium sp. WSM2598 TaxID=398261 RepID=UPI00037F201C|nr:hopanoid biosynthesis-associated protein HpnK [Methylobacterium sp. WSM2598]
MSPRSRDGRRQVRRLVVTSDDFGLSPEVNEAVERAHREGILSAASLMVAAPAAADAVARARRLPSLRVGLHLVMVEAWPCLPAAELPDLVDGQGLLRRDMGGLGLDLAAKPRARRQLAAEIRAQFEAYRATGLPLDHVNAHKHFHVHPVIAGLVLRIGRPHGMRALRVPREDRAVLRRAESGAAPGLALDTAPWAALLGRRARRAGLLVPDGVLGLAWSGRMSPPRVAALLRHLPAGLTELYTHPATRGGFPGEAPGYAYAEELAALTAPESRAALRESGAVLGGFGDFLA